MWICQNPHEYIYYSQIAVHLFDMYGWPYDHMYWGPVWQEAPGVLQQAPALGQEEGQTNQGEADLLQIPQ